MMSANISLYTISAALLGKKGAGTSVQEIAQGAIKILDSVEDDTASTQAANYIKGKTQNPDKQEKVVEAIRTALSAKGGYEPASIDTVIADIRTKLNLAGTSKPAPVAPSASAHGTTTGKVIVKKTGVFGDDGSPQVIISIEINNLPAGAETLSGVIRTNKDWPGGVARTGGKTSGTFGFKAYLSSSNAFSPFFIKVADQNGKELCRIPEKETLSIPFPQ